MRSTVTFIASKKHSIVYQTCSLSDPKRGKLTLHIVLFGFPALIIHHQLRKTTQRVHILLIFLTPVNILGAIAEFTIHTPFLGGFIHQLRLSHDGRGDRPEWYVDKVILDQLDEPRRVYEFMCGRWLSTDREDGSTSCVLRLEKMLTKYSR